MSYTAGANVFGGTMGMMLKGTGATSVVVTTITVPTGGLGSSTIMGIAHLPIGTMSPLSSATGTNSPGDTRPHSG